MRGTLECCVLFALVSFAGTADATILDFRSLDIDFTDPVAASGLCAWSDRGIITSTSEGLGWDGDPASLRDGWVLTEPLALGLSWRAPTSVSVRVTMLPGVETILLDNGQTTTPYQGDVYIRYSSDLRNWSTWQSLQPMNADSSTAGERHYQGTISVPYLVREPYNSLLAEYALMDVPWRSDEEAACRWIESENPGFFDDCIPFMGYIEFLWEGSFHGGRRLTSFTAEITYAMSGLHYAPEDESVYASRDSMSWSFRR